MGRISMPIMNKTGYSMFWSSMWDDKLNYTRNLKEDIFLKIFFSIFFEGGGGFMTQLNYKLIEDKSIKLNKKYKFQIKKTFRKTVMQAEPKKQYKKIKKTNFSFFLTKIWVLKYQSWVIIFFYSYNYSLSKFFKKRRKKFFFKKYFNILMNYYNNLLKTSTNYKFFKKNSFNKFSF